MSDQWDYNIRRMDIAWELAQMRLPSVIRNTVSSELDEPIRATLKEAWGAVEAAFPRDFTSTGVSKMNSPEEPSG